jgi:hypothetical protein
MGICERGKHAAIPLLSLSVLTERAGAGSELKLHVRGTVGVAQLRSPCQRIPRLARLPGGDQKPMQSQERAGRRFAVLARVHAGELTNGDVGFALGGMMDADL